MSYVGSGMCLSLVSPSHAVLDSAVSFAARGVHCGRLAYGRSILLGLALATCELR